MILFRKPIPFRAALTAIAASLVLSAIACGSAVTAGGGPYNLHLGYLANLTHAPALVGLDRGLFKSALPANVTLTPSTFNAGPDEVAALLSTGSDHLDAAFIGPSPAISAFTKSHGAVVIVSGSTAGGAGLVVRSGLDFTSPNDLRGRTLATPQLGNTQDVSLRAYLLDHGLRADTQGGGDVHIIPTDNGTVLKQLQKGKIDGAWVPEPWASRMVVEAGAREVVDEESVGGRFATTELMVTRKLLNERPGVVRGLLDGLHRAVDLITTDSDGARQVAGAALGRLTHSALAANVLEPAWKRLDFTLDPVGVSLQKDADNARRVGVSSSTQLGGILDLRLLNEVLRANRQPEVSTAGLGSQ